MNRIVRISKPYEFANKRIRQFVSHSLFLPFIAFLIGIFLSFSSLDVSAQCAMCKRIAETNMENNQNNVGKSLNKGILYLLSVPYLLGGIGLFAWYSERRRKRKASSNITDTDLQ